jgi:hypothetical protein
MVKIVKIGSLCITVSVLAMACSSGPTQGGEPTQGQEGSQGDKSVIADEPLIVDGVYQGTKPFRFNGVEVAPGEKLPAPDSSKLHRQFDGNFSASCYVAWANGGYNAWSQIDCLNSQSQEVANTEIIDQAFTNDNGSMYWQYGGGANQTCQQTNMAFTSACNAYCTNPYGCIGVWNTCNAANGSPVFNLDCLDYCFENNNGTLTLTCF